MSSGAAVIAYPGLAAYGSSKAALRMAGMVLGVELDEAVKRGDVERDAAILSFEPSMVDTPMQADARASSSGVLPMSGHPRFSESRLQPS